MTTMKITDDIKYVGVNDHQIDLFEGQFEVPNGMAYNSYVIKDEKIAVLDTIDRNFGAEWMRNIKAEIGEKKVDYLVVHHMEPDHSANIAAFAAAYPEATIVASNGAFAIMKNYFGTDYAERRIIVKEGSTLALGKHTLTFVAAPMVHWPEVVMSYDAADKVLFSADGFGKFGANDVVDPEGWDCEARRYYFGIVGKFGPNVQAVLAKAANLEIRKICALHGPVLSTPEEIANAVSKYQIWAGYGVESEGVCVAYTSVYGHTKAAVEKFAEILKAKGCPKVSLHDLARTDTYEAIEDAFRYGKLVLATTTYNTGIFPKMDEFIRHLIRRNYRNRKIGLIENGSWAPAAANGMKKMFEGQSAITFCGAAVTIKGAMTDATVAAMETLADEIMR